MPERHRRPVDLQRRRAEARLVEDLPDGARRATVGRPLVEHILEVALVDPVKEAIPSRPAVTDSEARDSHAVVVSVLNAEGLDRHVRGRHRPRVTQRSPLVDASIDLQ